MTLRAAALAVVVVLGMGLRPSLAADPSWKSVQPVRPQLVEDHEPELCSRVLGAAAKWFASTSLDPPDLRGVGITELSTAPIEDPQLPYGTERLDLDLDGDSRKEILLVTHHEFRMESHRDGTILTAEEEIKSLMASRDSASPGKKWIGYAPRELPMPGYWITDVRTLYGWKGRYYVASARHNAVAQADLAVTRVDASGPSEVICRVTSEAPETRVTAMRELPEIDALAFSIGSIGGPGYSCGTASSGTRALQGWTAAVQLAAVRPWTLAGEGESTSTWRFLEDWSAEGPWNWREYLALRESLEPARRAYARYLRAQFGLGAEAHGQAIDIVEQIIARRFWIPYPDDEVKPGQRAGNTRLVRDPRQSNAFGKTSLMMAAHMNRIDVVRQLLAMGADPNSVTRRYDDCDNYNVGVAQRTALMYAAENGSPLVMKALLDAGAKVDMSDSEGNDAQDYLQRNPRLTEAEQQMPLVKLAADSAGRAAAPGFDCARASSRAEKAICGSEALRLLDAEMSGAYRHALAVSGPGLKPDQGRWVAARAAVCDRWRGVDYIDCLADRTAARQRYLHYLVAP